MVDERADLNGDGKVDMQDELILSQVESTTVAPGVLTLNGVTYSLSDRGDGSFDLINFKTGSTIAVSDPLARTVEIGGVQYNVETETATNQVTLSQSHAQSLNKGDEVLEIDGQKYIVNYPL